MIFKEKRSLWYRYLQVGTVSYKLFWTLSVSMTLFDLRGLYWWFTAFKIVEFSKHLSNGWSYAFQAWLAEMHWKMSVYGRMLQRNHAFVYWSARHLGLKNLHSAVGSRQIVHQGLNGRARVVYNRSLEAEKTKSIPARPANERQKQSAMHRPVARWPLINDVAGRDGVYCMQLQAHTQVRSAEITYL